MGGIYLWAVRCQTKDTPYIFSIVLCGVSFGFFLFVFFSFCVYFAKKTESGQPCICFKGAYNIGAAGGWRLTSGKQPEPGGLYFDSRLHKFSREPSKAAWHLPYFARRCGNCRYFDGREPSKAAWHFTLFCPLLRKSCIYYIFAFSAVSTLLFCADLHRCNF